MDFVSFLRLYWHWMFWAAVGFIALRWVMNKIVSTFSEEAPDISEGMLKASRYILVFYLIAMALIFFQSAVVTVVPKGEIDRSRLDRLQKQREQERREYQPKTEEDKTKEGDQQ